MSVKYVVPVKNILREEENMLRLFRRRLIDRFGVAAILALGSLMALPGASVAAPAQNETPRQYCARVGNDDELLRPPRSLARDIRRLFDISASYALASAYYRCADGEVRLCTVGANLPCGKANTSAVLPAATQWCETHENSDVIPLAVTGHDTLYSWRCAGRLAKPGAPVGKLDARGFFAEYWKTLQ